MSKLINGLVLGVLILVSLNVSAQPVVTISPQNVEVNANQEFTVDVVVTGFNNIASFQFPIVWNNNIIEYVSLSNINGTALAGFNENSFGQTAGKLTILWFEQNFSGVTLPANTRLFTIRFRAKQNGTTPIAITEDPPGIEVTDPTEKEVGLTPKNATVTVGGGSTLPTFRMNLSDHTVEVGTEVCVRLTVENFTSLIGLQFSLTYNPAQLVFKQVKALNAGVTGLTAAALTNPTAGVLRFQWSNNAGAGITLPNGAVLLELCFDANAIGNAAVSFSNTPTAIEVLQRMGASGQQALPSATDNSAITVTQSTAVKGFQLRMNDVTVQPGEQFCLPVRINDFQDIVGLQFTITYNAAQLQYVEAKNFNAQMPGLDVGNISNPTPGVLRFQWNDQGFTGIDLANGTAIMELCFRARTPGTSQVQFSSNPLAIEVTQKVQPDDQKLLEFTTQNATVTIQGTQTGPGFTGFGVYMLDDTITSGSTLCVPVRVQDFDKILGMQFSIKFNTNALEFVEARNFGLNGLTTGSIGVPSPGVLTLVWDDPAVAGQTLADGAALMELCFRVKGPNGTTTPITFENSPTPIEFVQVVGNTEESIDYSTRNATITIGTGDGSFDGFGLIIADARVESGKDVCVPVTVQDFDKILGMQFSITYNAAHLQFKEAKNFGINGLSAGSLGMPSAGVITLVWDDPAVVGQTLADKATLMELCFTALAPNGTMTTISLANSPTPIEFVQVTSNGEKVIDYNFKPGKITIDRPLAPSIVNPATVTNVNCFGQSTGAINIEIQGGSGAYTYVWSYQNRTTQDLANLPAGNYSVTVTDSGNNLTVTANYTITQPAAALAATFVKEDAECGAPNGSIIVTATGGTSPYTFDWSGSLPDGAGRNSQADLAAGSYTFTITDSRGCTLTSETIQVQQKSSAQLTFSPTSINAGNDGAIALAITGGRTPYTYRWTGPSNFTSTQQNLSGLSATGQYCVTVTDADNCQTNQCVNLFQVLKFGRVDIVNACAGTNSGSIAVNMTGGQAPYTYQWNPNAGTGANLSNLAPGMYSVTVTDSRGDKLNGSFEVTRLSAIAIDSTITPVTGTANAANGSIRLTVSGGRPGYTIAWNTGGTGAQLSNLAVGNYCATVTDQNNCSASKCYDVKFQAAPLSFNVETTPTKCPAGADGALNLRIQGGIGPYEVVFADGMRMNSTGTLTRSNLSPGELDFTIRDAVGSTQEGSAVVAQPDSIRITSAIVVHDTDAPGCTGSIRLSISGGTPGYNVTWNSPNAGPQIINLCAGPFIPTVADARGCRATFDAIQLTTFTVSGQVANATCPVDTTGSVSLAVGGGASPYTYRWADDTGKQLSTEATLKNLAPGRYRVTVTEQSGNTLTREFVVASTSNLRATASVLSNFGGFGVSCTNASDGRLRAVGENGTGNYNYEWLRGEQMVGTAANLTNVPAGKYTVVVIDQSGCEATREIELTTPPDIVLTPSIVEVTCNGSTNGEIDLRVSGGAPGNTYTYQWSNGATGARLTRLRAGEYKVTVSTQFSCRKEASFSVVEPQPLRVEVSTLPASEGCNGQARAIVTGGTAPYTYRWNSQQSDSLLNNLCPGNYVVDVVDSRGCKPQQNAAAAGTVADRRYPCIETNMVITPNGDGDNEVFFINCILEFPDNTLEIYNRWGQLVFEAENYDNTWNGRNARSEALPEGAYYYVLRYTDSNGPQQVKGSLTLLRE